jgi:hypothetical protein
MWAESDAAGAYRIHVPPGTYTYDGYELDRVAADRVLAGTLLIGEQEEEVLIASADDEAAGPAFRFAEPVVALRPRGTVRADSVVFEWAPYVGASAYEVRVVQVTRGPSGSHYEWLGNRFAEPRIEHTRATPDDLGIALVPGQTYGWEIEAYDATGTKISQTPDLSALEFRVE